MSDSAHIVCPHCNAVNRIPATRLGDAVPPGGDYATDKIEEIYLELEDTRVISLTARPATAEEITVTASLIGESTSPRPAVAPPSSRSTTRCGHRSR